MSQWTPDEARKRVRERCASIPPVTMRALAKAHCKEVSELLLRITLAEVMADEYFHCADEADALREHTRKAAG